MFGLGATGKDGVYRQLRRHRLFECPIPMLTPGCHHKGEPIGVYGHGGPQGEGRKRGYMGGKREREEAMEICWMDREELSNAIPPAYTHWIGMQIRKSLGWLLP
jgi:DNA (cytosine-5)-methyltransferase 1